MAIFTKAHLGVAFQAIVVSSWNSPCGLELDMFKLCSSYMRKGSYIKGVSPLWRIRSKVTSVFVSTSILLVCLLPEIKSI